MKFDYLQKLKMRITQGEPCFGTHDSEAIIICVTF